MTLEEQINALKSDEGVSPVIAVILMVAITVVLAATVYVWVSGFATEDTGPEQAAATAKGADLDDNGDTEWIRVTLTSGENAPYDEGDVSFSVTSPNGTSLEDRHVCEDAQANDAWECGGDQFFQTDDQWDTGENLWVPCQADDVPDGSGDSGTHLLTVSVRDSTILDTAVTCHQVAGN